MSLKLKESVALDRLREFGFKPTAELIASDCRYEPIFDGCRYMFPWWHLFLQDPDTGGPRVDEDSGNPILHAWVDTCDGENCLWFDVMPECTYHAGIAASLLSSRASRGRWTSLLVRIALSPGRRSASGPIGMRRPSTSRSATRSATC